MRNDGSCSCYLLLGELSQVCTINAAENINIRYDKTIVAGDYSLEDKTVENKTDDNLGHSISHFPFCNCSIMADTFKK